MAQHIEYNPEYITFRKLTEADLPLIYRWLNTPHVHEWFKECGKNEPTLQRVTGKYLPRIHCQEPVYCYLVLYDNRPVAYIQSYRIEDFPTAKAMVTDSTNVAGTDTFIGEVDFLHGGFGAVYIRKFLREIVFPEPGITSCIIDPEPTNRIAIKAYEKAGFDYSHTAWNAEDNVPAYIMVINRYAVHPISDMV
jgi:RimJ/RimL family protein N-acetyltransferase